MAADCVTKSGNRCPKPALEGMTVCGLHQPDEVARLAFIRAQQQRANEKQKQIAHERREGIPRKPPAAEDILDSRDKIIAYLSRYAWSEKQRASAAQIAKAAIEALKLTDTKKLEAENERLRAIIEKYIPDGKRLLAELE